MSTLPREIAVAVDLAGCPNRCRHCWLGTGPNRRLGTDVLRRVAAAFREWRKPGEAAPYFARVSAASWYREPDFSDDYRQLHELERELGGREPERFELLSIWRICRDPAYLPWAKERGPRTCQISFFGGAEWTDWFHRRQGAYRDNLKATELLLENGMVPRWQVFLGKPMMKDLAGLMKLAGEMGLRQKAAALDAAFDVFCHAPGCDGEGFTLEDIRIEEPDLAEIPAELMESTREHFGGSLDWKTEAELTRKALDGTALPRDLPEHLWFFVNADLDMFSNHGDLTPAWKLGNFERDGLDAILDAFENDRTPGARASLQSDDRELAERFGRPESRSVYCPADLRSRWVKLMAGGKGPSR